jgi:hypothetical protein
MPSALDTFRAQQEAADAVYARLQDVSALLADLRAQTAALQRTDELKQLLEREERWLREAERTVVEVRRWRESVVRGLWRGAAMRWVAACAFALSAAAAAGAAYAAFVKPNARELQDLRDQAETGRIIEQRVVNMSAAERRQFDALMRWPPDARSDARRPGR